MINTLIKPTYNLLKRALGYGTDLYIYIYFEEIDVCFIAIPKNANTTINLAFFKKLNILDDDPNYLEINNAKVAFSISKKRYLELNSNTFIFAFSRNPLERLVSCYKNKILAKDTAMTKDFFWLFNYEMSFDEFVDSVCLIPDRLADIHFKSQTSLMYPEGETEKIDYLGSLENFKNDFNYVKNKYNITKKIESVVVSSKKPYNLKKWYTKKTARKVYKRYENDFKKLGYERSFKDTFKKLPEK